MTKTSKSKMVYSGSLSHTLNNDGVQLGGCGGMTGVEKESLTVINFQVRFIVK